MDLPQEMSIPSDSYSWYHVAAIVFPIYLLLFVAFLIAVFTPYPALALLVLPLLGAQIYKIAIIMHDCGHGTMFRNRTLNDVIGEIGGYFVAADFYTFRSRHWRHHARYGEQDDPQGIDYLDLEDASRPRLIWHLLRPLLGYKLFKVFVPLFGKRFFKFLANPQFRDSPELRSPGHGQRLWRTLFGIGVVQFTIALTVTGMGRVWWTVLLYPVAAATFSLFFAQTRGFAEHVAMPAESPVGHARTHLPNWFDKMFFYDLNFNYHIEHHAYPSVPSCYLPKVHEIMRETARLPEVSGSIIATIVRRFRATRVP
jgi:fatty acid desaturase